MLLRWVMEIDGTYLMHNNKRLSFSEGYQVGVYLVRPTFFLFQEVQAYIIKMLGIDEQMEIIGNIFSACESEVLISLDSGHSIYDDLKMTAPQYQTMRSLSSNAIDLDNFLPTLKYYRENEEAFLDCYMSNRLNVFGGIWEDEKEQIHVDASTWVQTLEEALVLGKKYNQATVWDWSIMKCRCTKTGEVLEY